MAKFSGDIGYAISTETSPGVHTNVITRKKYLGDILKNSRKWSSEPQVNDSILIQNRISIISDSFALANWSFMKFVEYGGACWEISNVDIQHPRLILTLGSVYNGPKN